MTTCSHETHHARGLCRRCYDRARRTRQARITAAVQSAPAMYRAGATVDDVARMLMRDVFELLEVAG